MRYQSKGFLNAGLFINAVSVRVFRNLINLSFSEAETRIAQ